MSKVIAILTSDWHLRPTVPRARSVEKDWYGVMERMLDQVIGLQVSNSCPILFSGDLFHQWHYRPEIVNWAINKLRGVEIYAIPGQHDLPYHSCENIHKSAYYTLHSAGVIDGEQNDLFFDKMVVHRRPWGEDLFTDRIVKNKVNVLLAHKYVWLEGEGYPGAEENYTDLEEIKVYNVVVFGDNHKGFDATYGNVTVFNCGCLIPSRLDEREYRPSVGLLKDDGTVLRHYLNIDDDVWVESEDFVEDRSEDIIRILETIESEGIDFEEVLRKAYSLF